MTKNYLIDYSEVGSYRVDKLLSVKADSETEAKSKAYEIIGRSILKQDSCVDYARFDVECIIKKSEGINE